MEIITAFGFACIATMAFAVLFQAPKKIVLIDGVIGAIGWVVFIYLRHELGYTSFVSNFCATISLALASELSSRIFKQPVTVFVIPGIVPLVPGLGIYQGMFAIINNEYNFHFADGHDGFRCHCHRRNAGFQFVPGVEGAPLYVAVPAFQTADGAKS